MDWRNASLEVAAAGQLALGVLALLRGRPSPLARPLGLLALCNFGWSLGTLAWNWSAAPVWDATQQVLSAVAPAFVLDFVLTFTGRRRARQALMILAYAAYGLLALASAPAAIGFKLAEQVWSALFLALFVPSFGYEIFLLSVHIARSSVAEQARARLVLVALVLGTLAVSTDVLNDFGVPVPSLGGFGSFIASALVMLAALRFNLLERDLKVPMLLFAFLVAVSAVIFEIMLFTLFGKNYALLAFGVIFTTLIAVLVVRDAAASFAEHRERTERLAILGRVSAQLSHDLKNPLSALLGAVQVLQNARSDEEREKFLMLVTEQADRLRAIVDNYERLARVEPMLSPTQLNGLAERASAAAAAWQTPVEFTLELDPTLESIDIDPELVASCLENLLRNAVDAMPKGGKITLRTERRLAQHGPECVLSVADDGPGMDARTAERAFDDFFTTKPSGRGLGLGFVRRVIQAHSGKVEIDTRPGRGTTIRLILPTGS